MTKLLHNRKVWLDWLKVLGMLFIIWGHTFPYNFTNFCYSFSVPLFFWASGFLAHTKGDLLYFFKKLWHSLIIPYLLICGINLILNIIIFHHHYLSLAGVAKSVVAIFLGVQSFPDKTATGIGALWFVYTLALIKIIHNMTSKRMMILLSLTSLLLVSILGFSNCHLSIASTLLCMPFYTIGVLCQSVKLLETPLSKKKSVFWTIAFIIGIVILFCLSDVNKAPYLYKLEYGRNIALMLFNALLGITVLYIFAKLMEYTSKLGGAFLSLLNGGMILILGFQRWFVLIVTYIIKPRIDNHLVFDLFSLLLSIVILIAFIPITKVIANNFPVIIGHRNV